MLLILNFSFTFLDNLPFTYIYLLCIEVKHKMMNQNLLILKTLKKQGFSNINIDQIFNYLETLDYNLKKTRYIVKIIAKKTKD